MKILVLGVYYADNMGDAVICDCVAALLRQKYPEAEIVVRDIAERFAFSGRETADIAQKQALNARLNRRRWLTRYTPYDYFDKSLRRSIAEEQPYIDSLLQQDFDVVVFAGGQMFMDWLSPYVVAYTEGFAQKGTPVLFNACGTGPASSRAIRQKLAGALALPNVRWVSTRDDASYIDRNYLPAGRHAEVIGDPGLWAAQVYGAKKEADGPIGLGIMFPMGGDYKATVAFWKRLLARMQADGMENWLLFCNGDAEDVEMGRTVLRELGLPMSKMAPQPKTPQELVQCIAGFQSLISFRLHSHIIAVSLGIPSVGIVWDHKLRFFFESIGCPQRSLPVRADAGTVLAAHRRAVEEGLDMQKVAVIKHHAQKRLYEEMDAAYGQIPLKK